MERCLLPSRRQTLGAIELVQEIDSGITTVTEDSRETVFLFQRLFTAVAFLSTLF